jgi:hypothetical protein
MPGEIVTTSIGGRVTPRGGRVVSPSAEAAQTAIPVGRMPGVYPRVLRGLVGPWPLASVDLYDLGGKLSPGAAGLPACPGRVSSSWATDVPAWGKVRGRALPHPVADRRAGECSGGN